MMIINDFCEPIALAATLSIAFVAVESVKSYTSVLCERFFKFQDFVKSSFEECRSLLTDYETFNHLDIADIGEGKTTVPEIEALKRERESLQKEIDETAKEKQNRLPVVCEAKSMSSLCLFVFLINTAFLFVGSIESTSTSFFHSFISVFSILSLVYLILGWCIGEYTKPRRCFDYSSLKHPSIAFGLIVIISLALSFVFFFCKTCCLESFLDKFWWPFLIAIIVASYLNFIIFVAKIKRMANGYLQEVSDSKKELSEKCNCATKKVNELIAATKLINRLKAD